MGNTTHPKANDNWYPYKWITQCFTASNELAAQHLAFNFQMIINQRDNKNDLHFFSAANSNRKQGHRKYDKELRQATRPDTWQGDGDTYHFSAEPSRHTGTKKVFSELSQTLLN